MDQSLKCKDASKASTWNAEALFESWDERQTGLEPITKVSICPLSQTRHRKRGLKWLYI